MRSLLAGILVTISVCSSARAQCGPRPLGSLPLADEARSISISEGTAYLASDAGVQILDVTDPEIITSLTTLPVPGGVRQVHAEAGVLIVAETEFGIRAFDVSSPSTPIELGSLGFLSPGETITDLATNTDLLYVSTTVTGLFVINIDDLSTPSITAAFSDEGSIGAIDRSADQLAAYSTSSNDLLVLDVSDPSSPNVIVRSGWGSLADPVVELLPGVLYFGTRSTGSGGALWVGSIVGPIIQGEFSYGSPFNEDRVFRDLYESDGRIIAAIDTEQGATLETVEYIDEIDGNDTTASTQLDRAGATAITMDQESGLALIAFEGEASGTPEVRAWSAGNDLPSFPVDYGKSSFLLIQPRTSFMFGNQLHLWSSHDDWKIYDMTVPGRPVLAGFGPLDGFDLVEIVEGLAMVLVNDALAAIDLQNPELPTLLEIEDFSLDPISAVHNDLFAAAVRSSGVSVPAVFRVSRENPSLLTEIPLPALSGRPVALAFDETGVLYVLDENVTLSTISFSNPDNPTILGQGTITPPAPLVLAFSGSIRPRMIVRDGVLYLTDLNVPLSAHDVSDPSNPIHLATREELGRSLPPGLLRVGSKLLATYGSDVRVYDESTPGAFHQIGSTRGLQSSHHTAGKGLLVVTDRNNEFRVLDARGCLVPDCSKQADLALPLGTLNFNDIIAFLELFADQDPLADLAEPIGTFNFNDIIEYLAAFGAGCP